MLWTGEFTCKELISSFFLANFDLQAEPLDRLPAEFRSDQDIVQARESEKEDAILYSWGLQVL